MRPFQGFRFWSRRAPTSERAITAVAGLIVVALLAWLFVPGDDGASTELVTSGAPSTATTSSGAIDGASDAGGQAVSPAQATGSASTAASTVTESGAASTSAPSGCTSPPGSDEGVSAKEIKVALNLVSIVGPAANEAFGVATPDEQKAMFGAVVDAINKEGGIACRKIIPQYFEANPLDQADLQRKCLDMAEAGVFAVIDGGAYALAGPGCFAQRRIPFFIGFMFTAKQAEDAYPYAFGWHEFDRVYRTAVLALRDRGFFSPANGFAKLGYIYRSCYPDVIKSEIGWLHEAGLNDGQIVTYDLGCPSGLASPSDLQQAVLKFKTSGVTNLTGSWFSGDWGTFTKIAEQQGFRPKYGFGDDQFIETTYGTSGPDPNNIANAIAITSFRSGENTTPGMTPSPGTVKCDNIYRARGMKPTWEVPSFAGNACDQLWMFKAAVEHAPALRRDALAAGLKQTGSIEFSYPQGPNDFSGDRVTTGGQSWRVLEFHTACKCWQVIDREFHPAFP